MEPTETHEPLPLSDLMHWTLWSARACVSALWKLAHHPHPGVHDHDRAMFHRTAVQVADRVLSTVPDELLGPVGAAAMEWRQVKGNEPTDDEKAHVLLATLYNLAPESPPPAPKPMPGQYL